ncbi:MAG: hypothetical protein H6701_03730 [Myxococcales bacterium]|nr:hypothetical protein [Myxococcales bacterium]
MKPSVYIGLLACTLVGCGGDGGGDDDDLDAATLTDGGVPPEASVWDAGDGGGRDGGPGDMAMIVQPDMGVARCFSEGGALEATAISDPFPGLEAFAADLDADLDGLPELLLRRRAEAGVRFEVIDGLTLAPLGGFDLPTAVDARFMPGLWPPTPQRSPITVDGTRVWYATERDAAGNTTLRTIDAETWAEVDAAPLGGEATAVTVVPSTRWLVLADRADRGCTISAIGADAPLMEWGLCRLSPLPDVNGDGQPEVLRFGRAGLELFDGDRLESIAVLRDVEIAAIGVGVDGPLDLRGQGPELVSGGIDEGALVVRYHDPIDLDVNGDSQTLRTPGVYERITFVEVGGELRIVGEVNRNEQLFLHLIEPGRDLRRLREFGPFQVLRWSLAGDIDADGLVDIELRGGSSADGTNTNVVYVRVEDGEEVYAIQRENSARFDPVWTAATPPAVADLDGCAGFDRVLLRSGVVQAGGERSTRLHFLDQSDRIRSRSDTYSGRVHQLTIADLDGAPPAELIELRSENAQSARLRVFTPIR